MTIGTTGDDTHNNKSNYLHKYNDAVKIDDILTVSKCGRESILINAVVQSKVETKVLNWGKQSGSNYMLGIEVLSCAQD